MDTDKAKKQAEYQQEYYLKNKERIAARKRERKDETNARYRERYATDEEFREKRRARLRVDREQLESNPEYQEWLKEKNRQHYNKYHDYYTEYWASLPQEKKEEYYARQKERYATDEEFREKRTAFQSQYNKKRLGIEPIPPTADFETVALERLEERRKDLITLKEGGVAFSSMLVREITGVSHNVYYLHLGKNIVNTVKQGKSYFVLEADLREYIAFLALERKRKKSK